MSVFTPLDNSSLKLWTNFSSILSGSIPASLAAFFPLEFKTNLPSTLVENLGLPTKDFQVFAAIGFIAPSKTNGTAPEITALVTSISCDPKGLVATSWAIEVPTPAPPVYTALFNKDFPAAFAAEEYPGI